MGRNRKQNIKFCWNILIIFFPVISERPILGKTLCVLCLDDFSVFNNVKTFRPVYNTHLFGDVTVLIDVVEVEGPVELLCDRTSQQNRQANDEVLKADWAVSVDVEGVEEEVGVSGSVCRQKEVFDWFTAFTGRMAHKHIQDRWQRKLQGKKFDSVGLEYFRNNLLDSAGLDFATFTFIH